MVAVDRKGLGEKISQIVLPIAIYNVEMSLGDTVLYPVKTHVHGFGSLELDGLVTDADGCGVVTEDSGGRLRVAIRSKDGSVNFCDLGVHEYGCIFCFSG